MHIKKVIIRGFKSYAHQADFDPFHSRTNVIGILIHTVQFQSFLYLIPYD